MSEEEEFGIVVLLPQTDEPAWNTVAKRCRGWRATIEALREVTKNEPGWQCITIVHGPDVDKILNGATYEGSVARIPDNR